MENKRIVHEVFWKTVVMICCVILGRRRILFRFVGITGFWVFRRRSCCLFKTASIRTLRPRLPVELPPASAMGIRPRVAERSSRDQSCSLHRKLDWLANVASLAVAGEPRVRGVRRRVRGRGSCCRDASWGRCHMWHPFRGQRIENGTPRMRRRWIPSCTCRRRERGWPGAVVASWASVGDGRWVRGHRPSRAWWWTRPLIGVRKPWGPWGRQGTCWSWPDVCVRAGASWPCGTGVSSTWVPLPRRLAGGVQSLSRLEWVPLWWEYLWLFLRYQMHVWSLEGLAEEWLVELSESPSLLTTYRIWADGGR